MQHDILGNPVTAMRERTLRAVEEPDAALHASKYLAAAELSSPSATRREQLNTAVLRAHARAAATLSQHPD